MNARYLRGIYILVHSSIIHNNQKMEEHPGSLEEIMEGLPGFYMCESGELLFNDTKLYFQDEKRVPKMVVVIA